MSIKIKRALIIVSSVVLTGIIILIIVLAVQNNEGNKELELNFDKTTAYFIAEKPLTPIAGEVLAESDIYEEATLTLSASYASRLQLLLEFADGQNDIEGLKISANGAVFDFNNELILFDSQSEITSVQINIKIFLASDAPESVAGKAINFYFVMAAI